MSENIFLENHRFEALFNYASIGILVTNEQGEIVLVNDFLLAQFEYENAIDLIGKKVEVLIPSRFHTNHIKHRNNYADQAKRRPMGLGMDLFALRKDGT